MANEKNLDTLEEELKLMKGELKQSLASVRDYLLNMELPSSEFATVIAALGGDGEQKMTMKGSFSAPPDSGLGGPATEEKEEPASHEEYEEPASDEAYEEPLDEELEPESELPEEEEDLINPDEPLGSRSESSPEDGLTDDYEDLGPEDGLFANEEEGEEGEAGETGETADNYEQDAAFIPESELAEEEEQPMEYERINVEVSQSTPKVNLLANLTNWVAKAKKEIGYEQLPVFLEVYGISGHLSSELKEVILHLAEISLEKPEDTSTAEIWSQAMLSLHGILTGGNAPLYPLKPSWHDGSEMPPGEDEVIETEVEKVKDMPIKLKLVFPNGDGKGKEYCINLTPEADNNGSEDTPDN
jgi:hypothetical protein